MQNPEGENLSIYLDNATELEDVGNRTQQKDGTEEHYETGERQYSPNRRGIYLIRPPAAEDPEEGDRVSNITMDGEISPDHTALVGTREANQYLSTTQRDAGFLGPRRSMTRWVRESTPTLEDRRGSRNAPQELR